jgi:hypothetical protein
MCSMRQISDYIKLRHTLSNYNRQKAACVSLHLHGRKISFAKLRQAERCEEYPPTSGGRAGISGGKLYRIALYRYPPTSGERAAYVKRNDTLVYASRQGLVILLLRHACGQWVHCPKTVELNFPPLSLITFRRYTFSSSRVKSLCATYGRIFRRISNIIFYASCNINCQPCAE